MNSKLGKITLDTMHPLEKWLRRIAWSCLFATVVFFSLAFIDGYYMTTHNQHTSPLLQDMAIAFGMIFFFTLSPAVLWLIFRKSYVKYNFEQTLQELEKWYSTFLTPSLHYRLFTTIVSRVQWKFFPQSLYWKSCDYLVFGKWF